MTTAPDLPPPPTVPGLRLHKLLRFSRFGETWSAGTTDGCDCAVTLVQGALTSAAEPLTRLRHEHLLPVQTVLAAGRHVALQTPAPSELTLATLCAARPVLDPGEVVTVGVPVAQALAVAHDRGIVHGDLDPADVTIDDEGRPVLIGTGYAGLAGHPCAPADDVLALAMILRALLGDDMGPRAEAVRGVLGEALTGQAAGRPGAGELAQRLALACPAQPLRRPQSAPVDVPSDRPAGARHAARAHRGTTLTWPPFLASFVRSGWRHPVRRLRALPGAAVAAGLAVAGVLLLLVAPALSHGAGGRPRSEAQSQSLADVFDDSPVAAPSATASPATAAGQATATATSPTAPTARPGSLAPTATNWTAVLAAIARARDAAFARPTTATLTAADAPDSTAAAVDAGRLSALSRAGAKARGLGTEIGGVTVLHAGADVAVVQVTESTSAYTLVGSAGEVLERRPAAAPARWTITLVATPRGWRTATVTPG